ncbi:MAG: VanZ family protein [Anaerolineales bacterium]|nr:VanZ family protein [Anaerolineales bacterium]
MDKRKFFLMFWVGAMLIPLEYFTKAIPLVRRSFDLIVSTELAHIIGHLLLFGGLVVLLLVLFDLKLDARTALLLAIGVILVGLGQEYFQLQIKGRGFGWPEVFDLWVDLTGAGLGWFAYSRLLPYRRYLRIAYFILRSGQPDHKIS